MIRTIVLVAIALVIAIGGGAWSVWVALNSGFGVGAVQIGSWSAFPAVGTPDADPYSKARFAREGGLALGKAEGMSFIAQYDSAGAALRRDCTYMVSGEIPPARFWTLYAADASRAELPGVGRRVPALHSMELLRNADGTFAVSAGPHPSAGNWLAVSGTGPLRLVLTLYDTPLTSARVTDLALPRIERRGCDA